MVEKFLLLNLSTVALGLAIVAAAVATALLGLVIVRRSVEVRKLRPQHDVAGFIIAVVGVIYAVLLAFMVVVQWEQYSSAQSNAAAEAIAIGNLYRDADSFGTPGRPLADAVFKYSKEVVEREYPYMAQHQAEDPNLNQYLNAMWKAVGRLPTSTPTQQAFARQAISDVSTSTEQRRNRIEDSASLLPGPLWVVLLVGGALTIGFTYFFGLESFAVQATMVSTLAVIISLSLFVILALDLPFTGDIAVQPTALKGEMAEFCSYNFVNTQPSSNCTGI
jgi:protein-S-isoprenylcysteine O-methyltransferase Ste14